jgi:uncharacterized protein (TIGR02145 family)
MNRKILLFQSLVLLVLFSCTSEKEIKDPLLFKVTTDSVVIDYSNLAASSIEVIVYGVTDQDNNHISKRGVCYGVTPNPTISNATSEAYVWSLSEPYLLKIRASGLKGNTVYHFRNYVVTSVGLQYGNDFTYTTTNLPVLLMTSINNITTTKLNYSCKLTSNGGSTILSTGIVWSKTQNPTIDLSTKINNLSDNNLDFSGSINNMEPATTYYVRCYATNNNGVGYSNEIMFNTLGNIPSDPVTDIDGNIYQTIKIGNQIWMMENLRTTRYRNGDIIGTTSPATGQIISETMPKYQWAFDGNESNAAIYGRLYTWYAATDSRNIAPVGWHLPNDTEFSSLETYLINNGYNTPNLSGFQDYLGKALSSTTMWQDFATVGYVGNDLTTNNYSGFNALPVGKRNPIGTFDYLNHSTLFWDSTPYDSDYAWGRQLGHDHVEFWNAYIFKKNGCSIRCIKDTPSNMKQSVNTISTTPESKKTKYQRNY